eukprot:7507633-Heterocapsa_arctica.AAC.1
MAEQIARKQEKVQCDPCGVTVAQTYLSMHKLTKTRSNVINEVLLSRGGLMKHWESNKCIKVWWPPYGGVKQTTSD